MREQLRSTDGQVDDDDDDDERTFEGLKVYSGNSWRQRGVVSHHVRAVWVFLSLFFRHVAAVHAEDRTTRSRVAVQLFRGAVPDAGFCQQTVAQETDSTSHHQNRPAS